MNHIEKNIRNLVVEERLRFKKHAIIRMIERDIKVSEVEDALKTGRVIELYPDDKPLESLLYLGYSGSGKALHAVLALDEKDVLLWVITVYEPDIKKWDKTLTKRR